MIIADIPRLVLHESHRFCKCVRSIIALIVEHSYRWPVLFIFWFKSEKWHVNDEKVINLFELEFLFEDYYLYRKKYIKIKFINFTKTLEEAVVFFETRPSHWYWKAQNSERNRAEYLTRISTVLRAQRTIFWYSSSGRWYRRGIYNANSRGQYHSSTRPSRTRGEEFARVGMWIAEWNRRAARAFRAASRSASHPFTASFVRPLELRHTANTATRDYYGNRAPSFMAPSRPPILHTSFPLRTQCTLDRTLGITDRNKRQQSE